MNRPGKAWHGRRHQFVCGNSAYSEQPGTRRASMKPRRPRSRDARSDEIKLGSSARSR